MKDDAEGIYVLKILLSGCWIARNPRMFHAPGMASNSQQISNRGRNGRVDPHRQV